MFKMRLAFTTLAVVASATAVPRPPTPTWPSLFHADFDVYMRALGPFWRSPGGGSAYFQADPHILHSYYYDYCPPMWSNVTTPWDFNFTCEFLFFGSNSTVYYMNPDGRDPHHPSCCVFADDLDPPSPDFCSTCTFVTETSFHGSTAYWWRQEDTGFTYASFPQPSGIYPPASLWASLAPEVGVLQVDYTEFNTTINEPWRFILPAQCYNAPVCNDVGAQRATRKSHSASIGIIAARP